MTAEAPAEAVNLDEPAPCPRERTRYPSRLAAGARNFHHSNPRKLPTSRRNFLKPSWFPSILEPLGLRPQKRSVWGRGGYKLRSDHRLRE